MISEGRAGEDGAALRPYRDLAVGRSEDPDVPSMAQGEREALREAVDKLRELVKKAEKGTKKAVPEIRKVLMEHPLSPQLAAACQLTAFGLATRGYPKLLAVLASERDAAKQSSRQEDKEPGIRPAPYPPKAST